MKLIEAMEVLGQVEIERDNVNHPRHYEGSTSIECIDAMELTFGADAVCSFCLCNAFKYLWRWKHKNGLEDLKKTEWYLNKKLELEKKVEWSIFEEQTDKLFSMLNEAKAMEEHKNEEH